MNVYESLLNQVSVALCATFCLCHHDAGGQPATPGASIKHVGPKDAYKLIAD